MVSSALPGQVLAGDPMHRCVEMRAGMLAEEMLLQAQAGPRVVVVGDLLQRNGADWPNCGGSRMIGVAGSSGTVRSTTRMLPPTMPAMSCASALEDFPWLCVVVLMSPLAGETLCRARWK